MLGGKGGSQVDDAPGWREKLDDLRAAPPWIIERPSWIREPPEVIALAFLVLVLLAASMTYLVLSPPSLPGVLPGHVTLPPVVAPRKPASPAVVKAFFQALERDPDATAAFWKAANQQAQPPPRYPTRHFDFAIISLVLAAAGAVLMWRLSWIRASRRERP